MKKVENFFIFFILVEIMQWVIDDNPESDTDTNESITGALIGSIFEYEKLKSDLI